MTEGGGEGVRGKRRRARLHRGRRNRSREAKDFAGGIVASALVQGAVWGMQRLVRAIVRTFAN